MEELRTEREGRQLLDGDLVRVRARVRARARVRVSSSMPTWLGLGLGLELGLGLGLGLVTGRLKGCAHLCFVTLP